MAGLNLPTYLKGADSLDLPTNKKAAKKEEKEEE
jgi:hypothetical protein